MADIRSTPMRLLKGPSLPSWEGHGERLWRWVTFSGLLHIIFLSGLFFMPHVPSLRKPSYPVYTVDLVGGEKLGGANLGSTVEPPPQAKKVAEKAKSEPQPQVKVAKKEKAKPAEKSSQMQETVALKKSKQETKKETKKEAEAEQGLPGQVREKLIQSALERVRERAESGPKKQKGEGMTSGPAEGEGAAAIGAGGRGGGIVRPAEFLIYYNQMLRLIRARWTWVGKRSDLEVKVGFSIRENGEIVGLKILQGSRDPSYDDSVVRAVRGANPLPVPPENYRKEFMDVELMFRPKDLGG